MACPAPGCFKPPVAAFSKCLIGSVITGSNHASARASVEGDPNNFVVAFCGSGTGHLTQAMKAVEMLQARGLTLTGIVRFGPEAESHRGLCHGGAMTSLMDDLCGQ